MDQTKSLDNRDVLTHAAGVTTPHTNIPLPGRLGDFQLKSELGRGGMGIVYLAEELGLNRRVALKILPDNVSHTRSGIQRFQLEARAAAQLNHDHIVPIYHIGEDHGTRFFAMKYVHGEDLGKVLQRARDAVAAEQKHQLLESTHKSRSDTQRSSDRHNSESGRSVIDLSNSSYCASLRSRGFHSARALARSVALLGLHVAEALQHAHEVGIIHRDIKPSNLMFDEDKKIWVTDFGLAQLESAPEITNPGDVLGTLRYMSPEQALGRRVFIDNRTDIYSLGVTLYELATLERARRGKTGRDILREITFERPTPVRKINPGLPHDFEAIICKAIERNPVDRYQTAAEMAADLSRFVHGQALDVRLPTRAKRVRDWLYERPALSTFLAASCAILLVAIGITAISFRSSLFAAQELVAQREQSLELREAQHLQTLSAMAIERDPGLATALAIEGASSLSGFTSDHAIMAALQDMREVKYMGLTQRRDGQLVCNPAGSRAVICSRPTRDGTRPSATLVDLDHCRELALLDQNQSISSATFTPDRKYLLTAASNYSSSRVGDAEIDLQYSLLVRDALTGAPHKALTDARVLWLTGKEFSSTGDRLVVPHVGNSAGIYRTEDWSLDFSLPHTAAVLAATYSPTGDMIATWTEDGKLTIWAAAKGTQISQATFQTESPREIRIQFSSHAKYVLFQSYEGIRICDTLDLQHQTFRREMVAITSHSSDLMYFKKLDSKAIYIYSSAIADVIAECHSDDAIQSMLVTTNDKYLIAQCNQSLRVYDAKSGDFLGDCRSHQDQISSAASIPNSNQFASVSTDLTLRIWNAETDSHRRTFDFNYAPEGKPLVDYSPDGSQALVGSVEGYTTARKQVRKNVSNAAEVSMPGELLDLVENYVLVADQDRALVIDPNNGREVAQTRLGGQRILRAHAIPATGNALLLTYEGSIHHWNYKNDHVVRLSKLGESTVSVAVSKIGPMFLLGQMDGKVVQYDAISLQSKQIVQYEALIEDLDLSHDATQLLIAHGNNQVALWNLAQQAQVGTLRGDAPITEVHFVRGGEYALTTGYPNSPVTLWNLAAESPDSSLQIQRIRDIEIDDQRLKVAIASGEGGAWLWDLESNARVQLITRPCYRIAFDDREGKVWICTERRIGLLSQEQRETPTKMEDASLIAWSQTTQQAEATHTLDFQTTKLIIVPNTDNLVVSGKSYGVAVVDVGTGTTVQTILGQSDVLELAAFVDDKSVLTVASDGRILLTDLINETNSWTANHEYQLTTAALTSDRRQLLTSDTLGRTQQWDLPQRKRDRVREHRGQWVRQLVLGASGNQAVSLIDGDQVRVWDLRSDGGKDHAIGSSVRHVALSTDESQLLLVLGKPLVTKHHYVIPAQENPERDGKVLLLELSSGDRFEIDVPGPAVAGRFVGDRFAILSKNNRLYVFDNHSRQQVFDIDAPYVSGLVGLQGAESTLYASGTDRIAGWDVQTGSLKALVNVRLPSWLASEGLLEWRPTQADSDWMLFPDRRQVQRRPKKPLQYASAATNRRISLSERERFLSFGPLAVD